MNLNTRSIVLVVVALAVAGITAFMARSLLTADRQTTVATSEAPLVSETEVLVAAINLPSGLLVNSEHLAWQGWPTDAANENYVVKSEGGTDEQFLGAVVRRGPAARLDNGQSTAKLLPNYCQTIEGSPCLSPFSSSSAARMWANRPSLTA